MIIHGIEESDFYQFILEEGRELGRQEARRKRLAAVVPRLRLLIARQFPTLQLDEEIEAIADPDAILQVFSELDDIHDPETLRRRLAELATTTQSSPHS
ncbi:MAG: hypothetical protein ACREEM_42750 [Blastocatellia bacterium]